MYCSGGDTLLINNGEVYVNNTKVFINTIKEKYSFKIRNKKRFIKLKNIELPATNFQMAGTDLNFLTGHFSFNELLKLKRNPEVYELQKVIDKSGPTSQLFAAPPHTKWTLDGMGPFIIPRRGMKIALSRYNFSLYKTILNQFEKADIKEHDGNFYHHGKKVFYYKFKQDYYFFMGDNRKNSYDSRYLGFIPETHIVGIVQCVLF